MKILITILNMKMITMTIMRGDKNVNNIDNRIHNDVFCLRIILTIMKTMVMTNR